MPIPITRVRTSHALTIRAAGVTVGLINSWGPTQSRTMTPIFEVGVDNSGNPVEYMPGNMSGMTIAVNRYDTYPRRMEEAFGTRDLSMLTRQSEPFDIFEIWKLPDKEAEPVTITAGPGLNQTTSAGTLPTSTFRSSPFIDEERFVYRGCWFSSLGRTLSSDDTRIVNTNATLVFTQRLRAEGATGDALNFLSQVSF